MMIPFDEKFPVHTETLTNVKDLNRILENDIRESGDGLQGRNASAKCHYFDTSLKIELYQL